MSFRVTGLACLCLLLLTCCIAVEAADIFSPIISSADLDQQTFVQWVDGVESPIAVSNPSGPQHVVWTKENGVQWDGVKYADTTTPGVRYMRIGFTRPILVGTILTRGGGSVSVLKATAAYPGTLNDDTQWIPAQRICNGTVTTKEAEREEYALWVLPPNTTTRALRFAHNPDITDQAYVGWLGGVSLLEQRMVNLAPAALAASSENTKSASKINNESNDGTWGAWDNWEEGTHHQISAQHPSWLLLTWPKPVTLLGLNALWAGFGAATVQAYTGPANRHPREATDSDWRTIKDFDRFENQYPRQLGPNWMEFGQSVTTRAIRICMTKVTKESHPHLNNRTEHGQRVWLGELQALHLLGNDDIKTVLTQTPTMTSAPHPPIPVRFTLKAPGYVTLVIEDANGQRVRNLVSETLFPAGQNVVWWDGMDDLGRDQEAAHHGIYSTPGSFVKPGTYTVRGLYYKAIDLRYEFALYNGDGNPPWGTADTSGGWLTNHTPPSSALFLPADQSPVGKPIVYLGSYISEGGAGLAWVDLNGRKLGGRGWVGGTWTAAPYLARDAGAQRRTDTYAYVGSTFDSDLRLTALTTKGDRQVIKYNFANKDQANMLGIAVNNGILVCSLPKIHQLLFVNDTAGKVITSAPIDDPRGVAFDAQGRLLVLVGKQLLRYTLPTVSETMTLPTPQVVITTGLEDPQMITTDPQGNLYISDLGRSHQVKAFTADGRFLRAIGHPGEPKAGPYDPLHMNNPKGLTIDANNHLWVAENDYQPKRVSVWTLDGSFVKAFYGPAEYGGGGYLDASDKNRYYLHGMCFTLDWKAGASQLSSVIYRPAPNELQLPDRCGYPETPISIKGQRYFTNCFNSNPTGGAGLVFIWKERQGIAIPVAAMGRANSWPVLQGDAFKGVWPAGVNLQGDMWRNQAVFAWTDLDADGMVQPNEVVMRKAECGGVTVMPDLSLIESRLNGQTTQYLVDHYTAQGAPVYNLDAGAVLAKNVLGPASSGGDQALTHPNGWTVVSLGVKPYAAQSLSGVFNGVPKWSYPSPWPGLHASHESPAPEMPGELIGTTRLLGGYFTPQHSDVGPLWAINGNQGNMYLFTFDGLFVATLFRDVRQGQPWGMPVAQRNMLLNDISCHDENFWPSITQTPDGQVYMVDGGRTCIVRVDGLDTLQRLPSTSLPVTTDDLKSAQSYFLQREAQRQQEQGLQNFPVVLRTNAPTVDGQIDDWANATWAPIDKRGVRAYFNSDSKPYDVRGAVSVAGDRLYAAFCTDDANLLRNSGAVANAPFKCGGALDLMIGTDPMANEKRTNPVAGDVRLLVTRVNNKTLALLYRAVVPGTKDPVPFSSPWRTITIDRVDDISDQVQLAGAKGNYEISVPLAVLGLKPQSGQLIKGDIGILRGDGTQTLQRVYWANKGTGITADVPSEAMLTPQLWGKWKFVSAGDDTTVK